MSSHHFVKEGQEPALFIIDPISLEQIEPLLEWAPYVMVVDYAAEQVMQWGIKIDIVLAARGGTDSIAEKLIDQEPFQIFEYDRVDDLIDIGINVLRSLRATAVNVLISTVDFKKFPGTSDFQLSILTQSIRWSFIPKGVFEKWVSKGTAIHVQCASVMDLVMNGLKESDNGFKAVGDGLISIRSDHSFWIGQAQ